MRTLSSEARQLMEGLVHQGIVVHLDTVGRQQGYTFNDPLEMTNWHEVCTTIMEAGFAAVDVHFQRDDERTWVYWACRP